uniref:Uncharacterized protein n=1 Tax=Opuntia streptacantha TaxID=393608 RepID=A0A7C8ZID9_OPUST
MTIEGLWQSKNCYNQTSRAAILLMLLLGKSGRIGRISSSSWDYDLWCYIKVSRHQEQTRYKIEDGSDPGERELEFLRSSQRIYPTPSLLDENPFPHHSKSLSNSQI